MKLLKSSKKLVDEGDENLVEIIKQLPKDKTKLSSRKTGNILNISKSGICNFWNHKEKTNNKHKNRKEILIDKIYNIMVEYFFRIGREPIAQILFKKYGIKISGRQVGRIMHENNLTCEIRVPCKIPERKEHQS